MTRYYCDYCDAFLTHDSSVVRKQHNAGFKHKANVKAYYLKFEPSFPALEAAESRLEYERQARGEPSHPPVGVRYRGPRAGLGEICAPGPGYRLPPGVSLPFNARGGPPGPRFGPGGPMRPGEWGSGAPPHGNFAHHVGGPGASHAGPGLAHRGPVGAAGPLPSKPTADKMAVDGGNAGTTAQGGNQEHKANAPGDASAPAADHATASKPAGASGPESSAVPAENPSEAPAASAAKLPAEAAPVAADSEPPTGDVSTAEPPAEAAPASPAPAAETA